MNGSSGKSRQSLGVSEDPEQTGLKIASILRWLTALNHTDPTRPASPCRETQWDRKWETPAADGETHGQTDTSNGGKKQEETRWVLPDTEAFLSHCVKSKSTGDWLLVGKVRGWEVSVLSVGHSAEAGSSYAEPKGIMTLASQEGGFKEGWTWQLQLAVSPSPQEWCET